MSQRVTKTDYQSLFEYGEYCDIVDEAFALCYAHLKRYEGEAGLSTGLGAMRKIPQKTGAARNISASKIWEHCERRQSSIWLIVTQC